MGIHIPAEYKDKLVPFESNDKRTDDEVLASLTKFQPVTSEKNIWTFWDSGIYGMPAWCRRNVVSWARICGSEWTIRILDSKRESPNYAPKYDLKGLPDAFYDETMDGAHSGPHSADFLRGICLYQYGGAWVDSSTFLMRSLDDTCWNQLEDPASPYQVAVPVIAGNLLNCFLAARKGDPFIKRWHGIFMHVWQGRTNPDGLAQHPLLAPFVPYFAEQFGTHMGPGMGLKVPFDKVAEYGSQMICWLRLCMLEDAGDGFSGADYWYKNILWIDCPKELLLPYYNPETDLPELSRGQQIFDTLATKVDAAAADSALYKKAEEDTWKLLTEASFWKIGTIKGMVEWVSIGALWNRPENLGKDAESGTFGELLRLVPQHFKQARKGLLTLEPVRAPVTFTKGVLEP